MARVLAFAALAAMLVVGVSLAQARADRAQAKKPLPGLPAWTAGYQAWPKLNSKPIPQRATDAHPGTKNVYASKRKRGARYPYGTVIVKEIVPRGSMTVATVAAMRKVRGANPAHNDWVMIEWTRSRPGARFGLLAQGEICTSCHVRAKANDYIFTRRRATQ